MGIIDRAGSSDYNFKMGETTMADKTLLENYAVFMDWEQLAGSVSLSDSEIRKYSPFFNKACWDILASKRRLSEAIIREFQGKWDWDIISKRQVLSDAFVDEFKHKLNMQLITGRVRIVGEFPKEFAEKHDLRNLIKN